MTVLVIGGTARARTLASRLARSQTVIYALAGVTRNPRLPAGCEIRQGPFGGVEGLCRFLKSAGVRQIVDGSHPHATGISANAQAAAARHGIPCARLRWRPWRPDHGDRWRQFGDPRALVAALAARAPSRVLLTLGARASTPVIAVAGHRFWLRSIEAPDTAAAASPVDVIRARGPFDEADEHALLQRLGIDLLVCKNSGLREGRAKLTAARALGIEVWLLQATPSVAR
ncbi:MAG: precorrin-6A/cobalt-precorrin-6A reductase [Pseudomonadota bacterium]